MIIIIIIKKENYYEKNVIKVKGIVRRFVALALAICMVLCFLGETASAAYKKYSTYSYSTGALWWKKNYNCTVYVDSGSYFNVWYGSSKVSTGFEYKNNTSIVLSQTSSFSLGVQTVASLNTSVDVEACDIKAGIGGSLSSTSSVSWGISNTSTRTIEKTAPKGYYSYNVCMNTKKIKITGTAKGTVYVYAPVSQAYRSIVYNKSNASYSGVTRY